MSYGIHIDSHDVFDKINTRLLKAVKSGKESDVMDIVGTLDAFQLADFLITSDFATHAKFLKMVGDKLDPGVLAFLDADVTHNVVEILGVRVVALMLSKLDQHDMLDVLRDLDNDIRLQIVGLLPLEYREFAGGFLAYPKDSAGRLVNDNIVTVSPEYSVNDVLGYLRKQDSVSDNLNQLFIVDENKAIVGRVYLSRLLKLPGDALMSSIMDDDFVTINANIDQEEVVHIFKKYSLTSAPVVADNGKIVGAISIEDVADVMHYEITDDIMKLGGVTSSVNINSRVSNSVLSRLPWLSVNVVFSLVISSMVGRFSGTISHIVSIAVLLPIVTSIGGCSASQSVSGSIRAIACREVTKNNVWRIFLKEGAVAMVLGLVVGATSGSVVLFRYHDIGLCAVYFGSVVGTFLVSSMLGLLTPVLLHRTKFDPAVASPVIVSAAVDAFSYLCFLGVATVLLL